MRCAPLVVALALLAFPGAANAAFPGENGKLVFLGASLNTINPDGSGKAELFTDTTNLREADPAWSPAGDKVLFVRRSCGASLCFGQGIWVVNADGTGLQQIANVPNASEMPAWAPDGQRFVYARSSSGSGFDLYSVGLDGSNEVQLTNVAGHDYWPAWSPDGNRIAFVSRRDGGDASELYVMNADGSGQTRLTNSPGIELEPNWSPDGSRIVFEILNPNRAIWSIRPDGTNLTPLSTSSHVLSSPAWSPDGSKIVTAGYALEDSSNPGFFLMNPDGSGLTPLTSDPSAELTPDWQPLPVPYARPKGATPMRVSLVPAEQMCTSPNRTHGPPLSFGSCNPNVPESAQLTTGTPDLNVRSTLMNASVRYEAIVGNPSTPADEADVALSVSITDVRVQNTLADYTGEVQAQAQARMTDHEGAITATAQDVLFPLTTQCAATADPNIGASCSLTTTLDTLIPGAVVERARTILQLGQVSVIDGGPDGDTDTTPNSVFLRQGIFVP